MISVRWELRDIKSKRLKWWPINQHDLQILMESLKFATGSVLTSQADRAIRLKGLEPDPLVE